jgi:2-succinyl-6-hydroxy-2,4-cyclohexadiene-1-carboxylate synthase
MPIVALHGFWGLPQDWDIFPKEFLAFPIRPFASFDAWCKDFIEEITTKVPPPRFLLGYSLGGRLALHAFCQAPELWEKGIFVSTHPGLLQEEEKGKRLARDLQWAESFRSMEWEELQAKWEKQPVFENASYRFTRNEANSSRKDLASHLTNFSLGKQKDFRKQLSSIQKASLWIAGERDRAFAELALEMASLSPHTSASIISNASHRVPWEQPSAFLSAIIQFARAS